ncbi:hypothetical protein FGIG_12649 [Fasciola gigantica]|uniref:Uncharacterized protein n=1 Tax=Fasciola gigantica TaxID=46835 RepID=A0A504YX51_FASGI|nr:hypothetical protein FGIG_12649 [Fasciola gigantica]
MKFITKSTSFRRQVHLWTPKLSAESVTISGKPPGDCNVPFEKHVHTNITSVVFLSRRRQIFSAGAQSSNTFPEVLYQNFIRCWTLPMHN